MPLTNPALTAMDVAAGCTTAWSYFDADWYCKANATAHAGKAGTASEALLGFYLEKGQHLGHSPNKAFDEIWYRRTYPAVSKTLGASFVSGFDHYCRGGFRTFSPHWLFDEHFYRRRNADLTDSVLADAGLVNGYDHYLRHGAREQRVGHRFFDPTVYLAALSAAEAQAAAEAGPFLYYLERIEAGGHEVRTSIYFDPDWYLSLYKDVAATIAAGTWRCALHHYLGNATPTKFDPLPEFSEADYLSRYPDIAAAVEAGQLRNGYIHFLVNGARERRSPGAGFDTGYYADLPAVRKALAADSQLDPFTHYLKAGKAAGLPPVTPPEERVSEGQAKTLFRRRAGALLPLFARQKLDFSCGDAPVVSVVMVVHNNFPLTLNALGSLRANFAGAIELVLVDSGSTDETRAIDRYVRGAQVLRLDSNVGFLRGCNAAFSFVSADAVLLLNNDVELAYGAVGAALSRLQSDARIGAVGGKIIRAHGRLQEAGSIVWRDGTTLGYLRDASPLAPEANFVRDVDFCSAVFLMVRRAVVEELGGFDDDFAPAYFEDTDLCVRIKRAGGRVVYDPSVVVHHVEYGSAPSRAAAEADIERNRHIFVSKHAPFLETRPAAEPRAMAVARMGGGRQMRVLFVEEQVPLRWIGSGFVRSNDIVRVMAQLGYEVTVFPIFARDHDPAAIFADMPDTVETMYDRALSDLPAFLAQRPGYYDVVWIARTHNLERLKDVVAQVRGFEPAVRVILDTEAIEANRNALRAALPGREMPFDDADALGREFANLSLCDAVVAVSEPEAETLRSLGAPYVSVVGHMRPVTPTTQGFAQRDGMLFVGAIHDMESPNYDGLCWFIDEVLPLIEESLGWETRLTVVGYTGADVTLERFRDHARVTLVGSVPDVEPLYARHRLFVAPTRFAAGTPYKVYEAASFGVPVVATELLCRQMSWGSGTDMLTAAATDAVGFARHVVALYRDPALWRSLRDHALRRLAAENSPGQYAERVRAVLGDLR